MSLTKTVRRLCLLTAMTLIFGGVSLMTANAEGSVQSASFQTITNDALAKVQSGEENHVTSGEIFDYEMGLATHTGTAGTPSTDFTFGNFTACNGSLLKMDGWTNTMGLSGTNIYGPAVRAAAGQELVRFNWTEGIAVKLTFKQNALLTVSHAEVSGIVASDNVIRIRTYSETDGTITKLSEKALYDGSNTTQPANYFGGEYSVRAGESIYYEYGCTGGYEKNVATAKAAALFPTFTADVAEVSGNVSKNLLDIISTAYGANGETVTEGVASFDVLHGTRERQERFDKFEGNALQTTAVNDGGQYASVYAGGASKIIRTNGAKDIFILKIAASKNAKISLTNAACANATNGTAYYEVLEGASLEGRQYFVKHLEKSFSANAAVAEGELSGEFHVPTGHALFLTVRGSAFGTNIYLMPDIHINVENYDETKAAAFELCTINYVIGDGENSPENKEKYLVGDKVTFAAPVNTQKQFVGWEHEGKLYRADHTFEITSGFTVKAMFVDLQTIGAGIKITGDVGLRFGSKISAKEFKALTDLVGEENVTSGTLMLPTEKVGGGLTVSGANVLDVKRTVWYGEDADWLYFYAGVQGLGNVDEYPARYAKEITSCAYVGITYADGGTEYFYSETIARSMYDVAVDAYNDLSEVKEGEYLYETDGKYSPYTAEQRTRLAKIIASAENTVKG